MAATSNEDQQDVLDETGDVIDSFRIENDRLRQNIEHLQETVEQLKKINTVQLNRLVKQSLLRLRIDELEKQIGVLTDE